ncbi:hypothetical protein D3C72_1299700 [compost metagenome]
MQLDFAFGRPLILPRLGRLQVGQNEHAAPIFAKSSARFVVPVASFHGHHRAGWPMVIGAVPDWRAARNRRGGGWRAWRRLWRGSVVHAGHGVTAMIHAWHGVSAVFHPRHGATSSVLSVGHAHVRH